MEQSLCLLSGISPSAEIHFRRIGIVTCKHLAMEAVRLFSPSRSKSVKESFLLFETASRLGFAGWFVSNLPPGHRVRAIHDFWRDVVFFDIETDGLSRASRITCVTAEKGGVQSSFVRGRNLHRFLEVLSAAKLLVGFNSKRFDMPMICKEFGLASVPAQVDLMDEAAHYGFHGGLKAVERRIGFARDSVACSNGAMAVELWRQYRESGSELHLAELLRYNRDDVRSLTVLARCLLTLSLENTGINVDL